MSINKITHVTNFVQLWIDYLHYATCGFAKREQSKCNLILPQRLPHPRIPTPRIHRSLNNSGTSWRWTITWRRDAAKSSGRSRSRDALWTPLRAKNWKWRPPLRYLACLTEHSMADIATVMVALNIRIGNRNRLATDDDDTIVAFWLPLSRLVTTYCLLLSVLRPYRAMYHV